MQKRIDKSLLVLLLLLGCGVWAQPRRPFSSLSQSKTNLVTETSQLHIQSEESIQVGREHKPLPVRFLMGMGPIGSMRIGSSAGSTEYDFDWGVPSLEMGVDILLFERSGLWGFSPAIGYFTNETSYGQKTALHMVPLSLSLSYRGQWQSQQLLVPTLRVGGTQWIYAQRGTDWANQGGSFASLEASFGVSLSVSQWGIGSKHNPMEFIFQVKPYLGSTRLDRFPLGSLVQVGGASVF